MTVDAIFLFQLRVFIFIFTNTFSWHVEWLLDFETPAVYRYFTISQQIEIKRGEYAITFYQNCHLKRNILFSLFYVSRIQKKHLKETFFFFKKVTLIAIRLRNFEPCFNWNKNVKVVGNKVFFNERRKRFVFSILFLENKWTEGLERNKKLTSITPVYLAPKGTFSAIFPVSLFSVTYDWSESYNSLFLSWSMILLPLNWLHCHLLFNCV